jgi:hypothetical protein
MVHHDASSVYGVIMRQALLVAFGVFVVSLWACGKDEPSVWERNENARKYYGDPNTPGTKAFEDRKAAEARHAADEATRAAEAAELAKPPMELPGSATPANVIGETRANVRRILGKGVRQVGDDDVVEIDGAKITIKYRKGRATDFTIRPRSYARKRDEPALMRWASVNAWGGKGRSVEAAGFDDGIIVYDATEKLAQRALEDRKLDSDRRKTFAEFLQRRLRLDGETVSVGVRGKDNLILRIQWAGCSESQLAAITEGALFESNKYGYSRVECDDGNSTVSQDYR